MALRGDEITPAPAPGAVTTNYVKAHWSFRRVDGQLYNIEKSVLWRELRGICAKVLTNGIVLRIVVSRSETYTVSAAESGTTISNLLAGNKPAGPSLQTRTWQEEGPTIFLVNYDGPEPTTGSALRAKAIKVGTFPYEGEVIEKWDCGLPNIVPVLVTNPPAVQPDLNRPAAKPPVAN
jgi:hypothetical protein